MFIEIVHDFESNLAWLQNGYTNYENTEKIDDFGKSNDRKAGKCAIRHMRLL